jgi:L-alanine-DL-glutamate epimerase-like enolase superfamily enzyme
VRLQIRRHAFRLARPFETSHGELRTRETLLVTLADGEGLLGHGEAAPLESYDGVSTEQAERALERFRAVLQDAELAPSAGAANDEMPVGERFDVRSLVERCRAACPLPQALAAIDTALWDIAAQRSGQPLHTLLAGAAPVAPSVPVSATIAAIDRARAAEEAAAAARDGFACVKVKVGLGDDAGRVAAARAAAGPQMALRLDANGAWQVSDAVTTISALAPAGLELVEEPVHGVAAMREVRERVEVRIAADETALEPGALDGAADAVCLKLARCGGVTRLLEVAKLARAGGCEAYLGSTLEGPVGIAAALHVAAALATMAPLPPCGLATLHLFEGLEGTLPVERGAIAVPQSPGLGIEVGTAWR